MSWSLSNRWAKKATRSSIIAARISVFRIVWSRKTFLTVGEHNAILDERQIFLDLKVGIVKISSITNCYIVPLLHHSGVEADSPAFKKMPILFKQLQKFRDV